MPPDATDPTSAAIFEALKPHADKLSDGSTGQLATLWREELSGSSPAVIKEVIAARLGQPQYAKFLTSKDDAGPRARAARTAETETETGGPAARPAAVPIVDQARAVIEQGYGNSIGLVRRGRR